ncbi:MAG: hypothetical protein RLZ98_2036 [Pseudomonadota bacterium]|jgi:TctA family transporter
MLNAAGEALLLILEPHRLAFLFGGVIIGLVLGILPGIGGLVGMAILLPFTFDMDPYTAFAFLLGMGAVTTTGDTIPAVLFGVPGTASSAATVLDGVPMARRGEAGRALSASYVASLLGGLFGAALLGVSIPLLRPLMLSFGSPEMLALAIFGISMVATLSGSSPLRGLTAAGIGLLLAMIGSDPQTGTLRWTFDSLYLWEGIPLVPLVLGIFALPELADLFIKRTSVSSGGVQHNLRAGTVAGMRDAMRNWWLILRCSWIGALVGAIPGMGGSVVDWLAYGHAARTEKGASETFGKGDVRGVIASESSNNAKEGGALVPTVAFGVPGSAGMAILLGAFLIHGLVPGPDMLTKNLAVTYSMVWSIAIANILGAGLCFIFSGPFAMIATLRYSVILPVILTIVWVGAFNGSRNWGDLYLLLIAGCFGWAMKQLRWPRPPLILGFVLGDIIERYMFISMERYGLDWLWRPAVMFILALAILGIARPIIQDWLQRSKKADEAGATALAFRFQPPQIMNLVILAALAYAMWEASQWNWKAQVVPVIVGSATIACAFLAMLNTMSHNAAEHAAKLAGEERAKQGGIHMDIDSGTEHFGVKYVLMRGATFFGWMLAFMGSMAVIGLIPTIPVFVLAFMIFEGKEKIWLAIIMAIGQTLFIWGLFDYLLTIPWPPTLLGDWMPQLKGVIPSV